MASEKENKLAIMGLHARGNEIYLPNQITNSRTELQLLNVSKYKAKKMSNSNTSHTDWTKAQIKAAIEETGVSMAALGRANGYNTPQTFYAVLRLPYPKVQKIVAEHLGVSPETIWPSRYKKAPQITPSIHRRVA